MEKFKICGPSKLSGEVIIGGAKNATLPVLCSSILTSDTIEISNVPKLRDVSTMLSLLGEMGASFKFDPLSKICEINTDSLFSVEASYDLVKTMRASILVLGPLLARFGQAKVSLPGGCAIGQRPVDQHIKGLRQMGANIKIEDGYIIAETTGLKGTTIKNDIITVTGTENLMMAACLADGETLIENAAMEPEIVDLASCLRSMGAIIFGDGTNKISIHGSKKLSGCKHEIVFDRIEAGTYLCAVAACGGDVLLKNVNTLNMKMIIKKLQKFGGEIFDCGTSIRVKFSKRPESVSFDTAPFPGFPTDMQAQFMAVNAIARGTAKIRENIFENRFMHVQELQRLGAMIKVKASTATITGVENLRGANVMATDLRASAGLVIAAISANGNSSIDRIYHLDRGYEQMDRKLNSIGASVQRIKS